MDYMPFGEIMREHNVGGTSYQYTGQEYDKESGIHNYRARLYDSDLGRFYGMDPAEQFASPFSYAGNNPVMITDPTGEEAITLGVVLIAAAISAASYTASVALSDGGFDNWDWGQFAISTAIGAATGAIAPGIGSSISKSGMSAFGKVATGVYAHGVIGGISGGITGGESGAYSGFAAGAFSSLAGSGLQAAGVQSTAGIVAGSALTGGISAELSGGDFLRGAGQGAIIGGLNHAAHGVASGPGWRLRQSMPNRGDYPKGIFGDMLYKLEVMLFQQSLMPGVGAIGSSTTRGVGGLSRWVMKFFTSNSSKVGTTVLGKYPQYIKLAGKLGANRFNIPSSVWNKMTAAEQWTANVKFLNRAIARGDRILLSDPVKNINSVTGYFRKELDYLISNGYKLTNGGTQLIK